MADMAKTITGNEMSMEMPETNVKTKKEASAKFTLFWASSANGSAQLMAATVATFVSAFLTDKMLIPAGIASVLMFISSFWDAVNDPIMGVLADRTRTKWGRYRPWLLPVPVQGEGAGEKIARAIKLMNEKNLADVIIVARGGGSLEDLWPFNEEVVARAIFDSELPVISAVGHETDFTIADFASDLRAPTPSAAAELAVPEISKIEEMIRNYQNRFRVALRKNIEFKKLRFEKCMQSRAYKEPTQGINERYIALDMIIKNMTNSINNKVMLSKKDFANYVTKLDALSPLKTLARGYSIATKDDRIVKSVKDLESGDKVTLRFADGSKEAEVV